MYERKNVQVMKGEELHNLRELALVVEPQTIERHEVTDVAQA